MDSYKRQHKRMRGGWDVGPDEFKSLGFTIGLPPNIYIPQTKQISDLSQRFEDCDEQFASYDSNFAIQERAALFEAGKIVRCFVNSLPPNITEAKLKQIINQTLYKKNLTSQPEVVHRVSINPQGQFAFVDFEKARDAERFVELKDSFIIDGFTLKIRKSTMATTTDTSFLSQPEHLNSFIVYDKAFLNPEMEAQNLQEIKNIVSLYANVDKVQMPKINNILLGYVIVDLFNPDLTDIVILKLRICHNLSARRCFAKSGEYPRDRNDVLNKISYANLKNSRDDKNYSIYPSKEMTVADIFNLDVDVSTLDKTTPETNAKFLKIYNVLKNSNPDEIATVVNDMKEECEKYGKVINAYADVTFPKLANIIPTPIIIEFDDNVSARTAQKSISGLQYCGRTVITCIENPIVVVK